MMDSMANQSTTLTFSIKDNIRKKHGTGSLHVESIKIVRLTDKQNTRSVYVCTGDDDVLEEIEPTPLGACGLMTIMDGRFVLIEKDGETTLHFVDAWSEEEVIDTVLLLSEKHGIADGIRTFKSKTRRVPMFNGQQTALEATT